MSDKPRPTRVRYLVVASAALMSAVLYLDRFCISFAERFIQQDLGLTNQQIGWVLSAFFWTYALAQVPSGWLTDRFGSRIMLTLYVLTWSGLTCLIGAAQAFVTLLVLRLLFGLCQAGAYPTASSIVSKWVPLARRGTASSVIAVGGRVGGFLALFASGYLIVWLTPMDTPVRLQSDDLLDAPLLCYQLHSAQLEAESAMSAVDAEPRPVAPLRRRCLDVFDPGVRDVVRRHGDIYADLREAERQRLIAAGKNPDNAVVQAPPVPQAERTLLAEQYDAVIAATAFFAVADLEGVSVEKEAERLMEIPASERTEAQTGRLNRLIVEAVHRGAVKQLYVAGWRPMMVLYGAIGILVAGLIWWSCRTTPADHPWTNEAEVELIASSAAAATSSKAAQGVPLRELLTSFSMWMSCASQWFTNIGWLFLMTWAPRYFATVHKLSTKEVALLVSIPPLVGWAGMLMGGALTDLAVVSLGRRWGRALPISVSRFMAMAAYLLCLLDPSPYTATLLFSIVAFSTDLGTAPTWAFTQDVGGRQVGSVLGWGNMWGNLGAAITPPLLIWIVGEAERWDYAFMTCAAAFFCAGVCALGINAAVPIVPEDDGPSPSPSSDAGEQTDRGSSAR